MPPRDEPVAAAQSYRRKRRPTTVIGLLKQIAEHTQRHVGHAISGARLLKAY